MSTIDRTRHRPFRRIGFERRFRTGRRQPHHEETLEIGSMVRLGRLCDQPC
jgi:hypothetical protein